jgi:hypothetical protein
MKIAVCPRSSAEQVQFKNQNKKSRTEETEKSGKIQSQCIMKDTVENGSQWLIEKQI